MRIINRLLGFLLAAALLVASVIVIVEVIAVATHSSYAIIDWHVWYRWAARTEWKRGVIRVWAVLLILAGLLLLALQLKPRRTPRLRIAADDEATDAAITRRGLRDAARTAATSIDGVSAASVVVSRRKITVTGTAAARDRAAATKLTDPVTQAIDAKLKPLRLRRQPPVSVRMKPRSE